MMDKANILVVDDEPLNVELLKGLLQSRSYHVLTAAGGAEALEIIRKEKVDMVLLDVMMPLMDGFEVTRKIRSDEKTKGLPVVLITALKETEDRIEGIEAGCDDFISKPFDKNEVMARVKTLLQLNFYRSQLNEKEKFEILINRMSGGMLVCDGNLNI